ncbi:MAG: hypothetical protein K2I81_02960 [Alphaproteobacteria bacterium]|nr:hypothetical protein [Alphaproteobacteria bacterium]
MKKKLIIDLNGVVFEPVDQNFSEVARADYGRVKGAALTLAYKYGIGRRFMAADIANVLYKCAKNPKVRSGAIEALDAMARMPGVTIEFCGQMAFPGQAYKLEQKYRAIAPCMNVASHYELISPFASKRGYLCSSTAADENVMNYILGTRACDLDWPARWRIIPVLIAGAAAESNIHHHCNPRVFTNLHEFKEFLARRR